MGRLALGTPFLGLDSIGARPKTAADVVAVGDLIRIEQHEAEWRLGQLPDIQGALVALDPKNGAVRALVGGWDFHSMQFNHALQARRQPGSGFKPFVYSAALANGLTPASVFWDSPLVFDDANLETVYRPRNDSGEFSNRPMRLREALYRSRNVVSMRMMRHVRAQPIVDHVQRFGFEAAALPRNTQLAIGGGNMATTPIEMARAYSVFANGGLRIEPHVIDRVSGSTVQCSCRRGTRACAIPATAKTPTPHCWPPSAFWTNATPSSWTPCCATSSSAAPGDAHAMRCGVPTSPARQALPMKRRTHGSTATTAASLRPCGSASPITVRSAKGSSDPTRRCRSGSTS